MESSEQDCKALLHFIETVDNDDSCLKSRGLLQDLVWKAQGLSQGPKQKLIAQGLYGFLKQNLRSLKCDSLALDALRTIFDGGSFSRTKARRHFDLGIMTTNEKELNAVLLAFKISRGNCRSYGPDRYWFGRIGNGKGHDLSVVVAMVGRPRNVPCAVATCRLLELFTCDLAVLVGIAGGLKRERNDKGVKLGDVVCCELVIDYEHVRLGLRQVSTQGSPRNLRGRVRRFLERNLIRPLHLGIQTAIGNDLAIFVPEENRPDFIKKFQQHLLRLAKRRVPYRALRLRPSFHRGTSLAGEKLFANGRLKEMRLQYHERVLAVDQEDSGFAQACNQREPYVPWIIFRGISDYSDIDKPKAFQDVAALAASTVAFLFLTNAYRPPRDRVFPRISVI
jgi:nucleoside phosphorylase